MKESYDELVHKVSWPSFKELQSSAVVVAVAALILALVVFLMVEAHQDRVLNELALQEDSDRNGLEHRE